MRPVRMKPAARREGRRLEAPKGRRRRWCGWYSFRRSRRRPRSRTRADPWSGTARSCWVRLARALGSPFLDLASQPKLAAPLAEVDNGSGHRGIPPLVEGHGVSLREAQELCQFMRVDDVVRVDVPTHDQRSLQR